MSGPLQQPAAESAWSPGWRAERDHREGWTVANSIPLPPAHLCTRGNLNPQRLLEVDSQTPLAGQAIRRGTEKQNKAK